MDNNSNIKKAQDDFHPRKAVIIADSYTDLMNPINIDTPEILLPVCNIPLLEYMIDYLTSSSIKEIIICAKTNQTLENYIRKFHKKSDISIKLIISDSGEEFTDMGDCLRKINAEKLINSDFLLIRGLVITNIDLDKAFNFHLKKKEQDPNLILTSILKTYKNDKDMKTKYDENFLIYDKNSSKILQYESTYEAHRVKINENAKFKVKSVANAKTEQFIANYFKIRSDLYDTFIDICTPDLLDRYSENFDYHSIRDHIYKNLIVSDVYTDTFYLYEVSQDEYVGVIKNVDSYHRVNREILNRWSHPLVLEHISLPSSLKINYKAMNMNIYVDSDVIIDSHSKLISSIALAKGCIIEENAEISNSVIGKSTQIFANAKIKNSVIYSQCKIGKETTIINSIIGNKVVIANGITIVDCVIGDDVNITSDEKGQRIYLSKDTEEMNDSQDENSNNTDNLVKVDSETFLKNLEDKDLLFVNQENKVEEDNEDDDDEEESVSEEEEVEEENYEEEIRDVLKNGIEKDNKVEDILQEISSLKNSFFEYTLCESKIKIKIKIIFNFLATKMCFSIIFKDFSDKIIKNESFGRHHIADLEALFRKWKGIFTRFVPNENEQLLFISVLEDLCIENPKFIDVFHVIVQILNKDEFSVLSDDVIERWADRDTSEYPTVDGGKEIPAEYHKSFKEKMKKFLEQLKMY